MVQTITRQDQELVVLCRLMHSDLGIRSDNLLLWLQRVVLFELEVSDCSRQSEIALARAGIRTNAGSQMKETDVTYRSHVRIRRNLLPP